VRGLRDAGHVTETESARVRVQVAMPPTFPGGGWQRAILGRHVEGSRGASSCGRRGAQALSRSICVRGSRDADHVTETVPAYLLAVGSWGGLWRIVLERRASYLYLHGTGARVVDRGWWKRRVRREWRHRWRNWAVAIAWERGIRGCRRH